MSSLIPRLRAPTTETSVLRPRLQAIISIFGLHRSFLREILFLFSTVTFVSFQHSPSRQSYGGTSAGEKPSSINALRRQQQPPRAVAVAFRQRYDEHHNRGGDLESPVPLVAQDLAGDLSAPNFQRNSEPAVMSAVDVPVISALSLQPASAAIPASAEIPIPRTMAPSQQYMQMGERATKLSAVPSRHEVLRVMEVLLSNGTPFKPIDVVHVSNHQSFTTLLKRRFATDPDRRDFCNDRKYWSNQLFCRELNLTVSTSAVNRTDKLSFIETVSQVARLNQ